MSHVDDLLAETRAALVRITPQQAWDELTSGALLVDTRTETQRSAQGELPGALVIDRTVLEWRLDPTSEVRIPEAYAADVRVIVICRQGYSSSFAARALQRIGLTRATDVVGGVEAWLESGLPVGPGPADVRE